MTNLKASPDFNGNVVTYLGISALRLAMFVCGGRNFCKILSRDGGLKVNF